MTAPNTIARANTFGSTPTPINGKIPDQVGDDIPEKIYLWDMPVDIAEQIKKLSPLMDEKSEIFRELSIFFGGNAKVDVHHSDLSKFLGRKRLYRVIRLKGESYKDCVYQLVDDHPESMDALGMLRYYKAPAGRIQWEEIEKAEIAMGKELTVNAYGWEPDAWTLFQKEIPGQARDDSQSHEMVAILAFDFGD